MKTGIKIGNKQSKKHVNNIILLLETINKENISDEVGIKALETYTNITKVKNVHITNCTISNTKEDAITTEHEQS